MPGITSIVRVVAILAVIASGPVVLALSPEEATQVAIAELRKHGIKANAEQIKAAMKKAEAQAPRAARIIRERIRQAPSDKEVWSYLEKYAPKYRSRLEAVLGPTSDASASTSSSSLRSREAFLDPSSDHSTRGVSSLQLRVLRRITNKNLDSIQRAMAYRVLGDLEAVAPLVADGAPVPVTSDHFFERLSVFLENNLRIRNDSEEINGLPVADEPAKFAWVAPRGEKSYYAVDAAVMWTPDFLDRGWKELEIEQRSRRQEKKWDYAWRVRPSFDAHVSTQEEANRNNLAYSLPLEWKAFRSLEKSSVEDPDSPADAFFSGHSISLTPTYVTDRSASVRTWGVDFAYEPSIPLLRLNGDGSGRLFDLEWIEGKTTARFGGVWRNIETGAGSLRTGADYAHFRANAGFEVILWKRLTLNGRYVVITKVWGDEESHAFCLASASLRLDNRDHFTVGVTYVKGEEEPLFQEVDAFTAWVGVKF